MASKYHPISSGLWNDPRLSGLTFETRAFFAFLCSNDRVRPSGIYVVTDLQLSVDAGLSLRAVERYLRLLHDRDVIRRDAPWLFVRKYLKRQPKQQRLLGGVRSDVSDCDSRMILEDFGSIYSLFSRWSRTRLASLSNPSTTHVTTLSAQSRAEQSRAIEAGEEKLQEKDNSSRPTRSAGRTPTRLLGFDQFKAAYPRREAWPDAEKAWRQVGGAAHLVAILADIRRRLDARDWEPTVKERRRFIPLPASYLRARRWEDEVPGVNGDAPGDEDPYAGQPHLWDCPCGDVHEGVRGQPRPRCPKAVSAPGPCDGG